MTLPDAEAIFLALSDVAPGDRESFLHARCGNDAGLRREVDRLIAALDVPDEFLDPERIPTLDMAAVDGPLQPGSRLGDFLVLHALGSGGMGVVYAAQQDRPRRTVAIKVLRRGFRHPEILRRFENEAEMLGRLQHPGIAQVYAFYPGDRATPAHLVMELVSGPPLTDYARAERLSIAERVSLMIKLVDALQHAHQRGIIHRDIKPANVLVAEGAQPKVLDFGIARATEREMQRLTHQTAHGQFMGTLAYMSPEQLRGGPGDVGVQSDVYALGVLLYRLLTDRLPFEIGDLSWPEAIRRVLETEPPPLETLNPSLAGSLSEIVKNAMAREMRDRYGTAAELSIDLRRFLDGRAPARSIDRSAPAPGKPPAGVDLWPPLTAYAAAASQHGDGTICVVTIDGTLSAKSAADGQELWRVRLGDVSVVAAAPGFQLVAAGLSLGSIEVRSVETGALVQSIAAHEGPVVSLAFFDDGALASSGADGCIRVWDARTARLGAALAERRGWTAALTPLDGRRLLAAWSDGQIETLAVPRLV